MICRIIWIIENGYVLLLHPTTTTINIIIMYYTTTPLLHLSTTNLNQKSAKSRKPAKENRVGSTESSYTVCVV